MKRLLLLFLLSSSLLFAQSGRKAIYPVILVHGLNSSDGTWIALMNEYRRAGYNVAIDGVRAGAGSRIDFNLNADGDLARATTDFNYQPNRYNYGDVLDLRSPIDGSNDVFVLNFDNGNLSNQSAIYKQGFAVGIAIQKVLAATKAEKVILVGHSMGGLAIREYLQNSRFLFYDDNATHKVYKAVTIGTPHGGSNNGTSGVNFGLLAGVNERSEAVRDLRSNHVVSGQRGIYLWGGLEQNATYGIFGQSFVNVDINCNGRIDEVGGINQAKAGLMPSDVYFDCLVTEVSGILGSDGVVTTSSQNMNNFILKQLNGFSVPFADVIKIDNVLHTKQTEQSYSLIKSAMKTLNIPISFGNYYVFLTGNVNPNNSTKTIGSATYFLTVKESGKLSVDYTTPSGVVPTLRIQKDNGNGFVVVSTIKAANVSVDAGVYYISAVGELNRDNYATANLSISFMPNKQEPTNTIAESSVYPNPTAGFLRIKSDQMPTLIDCVDILGKSVAFSLENGGIDIQQKGLVFVRVDGKTHRVLVE